MKNYFIVLFFLVLLFGCKTALLPQVQQRTKTTVKDSVATRTATTDSLAIFRKAEQVTLKTVLAQLGETPITKTQGAVTAALSKEGDQVICDCRTEELNRIIALQTKYIEHFTKEHTLTETETTHVKKEMPGWAKPFLYLGIAMTIGVFGLAVLFLIKLKSKIV